VLEQKIRIWTTFKENYTLEKWVNANLIEDWLSAFNTPAYLGGIGGKQILQSTKWFRQKYKRISEIVVKPLVRYPNSKRVDIAKESIFKRTGHHVSISTLDEATQPKNKIFKPDGMIKMGKVFKEVYIDYGMNILDGISFANSLINGTLRKIKVIKPIIREEIRLDKYLMEGYMSLLTGLSYNDVMIDNVIHIVFKNSDTIIERKRHLSNELWKDWVRGRVSNQRPIRVDISSTIVGTYYNLNVSWFCGSLKRNNKLSYTNLREMLKRLETVELDIIVSILQRNGIYLLN
jgi:hypothetical protein